MRAALDRFETDVARATSPTSLARGVMRDLALACHGPFIDGPAADVQRHSVLCSSRDLRHSPPPMTPARFVAYADGSSLRNPGGPGGTGFIVFDRQRSALRFGGNRYVRDGDFAVTNNRMELRAVLQALDGIPDGETVEVFSDSRYVVDALS